jgi:hypothetical protein
MGLGSYGECGHGDIAVSVFFNTVTEQKALIFYLKFAFAIRTSQKCFLYGGTEDGPTLFSLYTGS